MRRITTILLFSIAVLCCPVTSARAADNLYGAKGIRAEAVRQGKLGSCYFHAVIAALAARNGDAIRKMIRSNPDGSYTVTFPDGKQETAYPDDLRYTHESGYDLSDGEWVAVLFRAYAQRVLRGSLLQAIEHSDTFALLKQGAQQLVASSDPVVLAYDRAIRAEVDQDGNIDRNKLEARLREQMNAIAVPDSAKSFLISTLESGGFFDKIVQMVHENGELFGAYRAVGQGGVAERVMEALVGSSRLQESRSESQAAAALEDATHKGLPTVACTAGSRFYQEVTAGHALPPDTESWYVNAHCYTVLGYDAGAGSVNLRNPWARHPDPDGVFNLPLALYLQAYLGIVTP